MKKLYKILAIVAISFAFVAPSLATPIDPSECLKIVCSSNSTSSGIKLNRSVSDKLPTYENATDLQLWYSKNNGATWTRWADPSVAINFNGCSPDKTILLKGQNPQGFGHPDGISSWHFVNLSSYIYTFSGNLMAVIDTLNLDGSMPIPAYCFDKLFTNYGGYLGAGTSVTLPSAKLSKGCYREMFNGCTALTSTPDLSVVTRMAESSMRNMFSGCTGLTTVAGLPQADTIAPYAMCNMFNGCTSLYSANVPAIVAKFVDEYGCYQMFRNCSSANFATPPAMPNLRNIALRGCDHMYFLCTNLTSSPCLNKLEVVKPYGCYQMFDSCLKMTTIDTIKARRLEDYGCARMFWKTMKTGVASNSSKINALIVDTIDSYGCYQMFCGNFTTSVDHYDNVLSAIDSLKFKIIGDHGCEQMCYRCTLQLRTIPSMIGIQRVGAYGCYQMFYGCPLINSIGNIQIDTIGDYGCAQMFYNACSSTNSTINHLKFDVIGNHGCEQMFFGNSYALRDENDDTWTFSSIGDYGCAQMFVSLSNARSLKIPTITANTVGDYGMYRMFYTCNQVATVGPLTIRKTGDHGCYQMYAESFTGLTPVIGDIRIDTIGSYGCAGMFYSTFWSYDSKVNVTPSIEAKLVGDHGCYQMFYGNRRLTTINDISATKLMDYACAEMFHRTCSTTLVSSCTVGKIKADTIGNYGMYRMFSGDFINSSGSSTHRYESRLSSVDTIITKLICSHGCERMFECCTLNLATSPAIKAQRIEESGCYQMFWSNGSLTRVKPITVDTICTHALDGMFTGCGAINTIGNITADTIGEYGCNNMFATSLASGCTMGNITATALGNYAMYQMFNSRPLGTVGNIAITRAHDQSCYQMFNGCTTLASAGNISVGSTTDYSLANMFNGCTGLTTVGGLTIGSIGKHGCELMFYNCNKLATFTNTPSIPGDHIDEYGCYRMFEACASLPTSPTLAAPLVAKYGYARMFFGCTALTTATASLPTLVLDRGTYYQMFTNCSNLTAGPAIGATDIGQYACDSMFFNCSKLAAVPDMSAVQTIGDYGCKEMFRNCAALPSVGNKTVTSIGTSGCQWMFHTCSSLAGVTNLIATTIGDYGCYQMFTACDAITNVDHLSATTIGSHGCELMFYQSSYISTVSNLTATNVGLYGCAQMFYDDVNGSQAANHYASNISFTHIGEYGCYRMFNNTYNSSTNYNYWTSLDGFSAETIGPHGCQEMMTSYKPDGTLKGLAKFTTATNIRLGSLAEYACYRMFASNTALSNLDLEFTNDPVGDYACYQMFQSCTSLPSAKLPLLPATTVGDYGYTYMFNGCTALSSTQTTLPATNLGEGAYKHMFANCSTLVTIPAILPATTIPAYAYYGMFQSCTSLNSLPTLPATTVGDYGYASMFQSCTALKATPAITLQTIGDHGCASMYNGCSAMTTTGAITIDVVGDYGCELMFANSWLISSIGRIQIGEVKDYGCSQMFYQSICHKNLHSTDIPLAISIDKIGDYGCYQMFYTNGNNTSPSNNYTSRIKRITELSLGEVGNYGCSQMFISARYINSIPESLAALQIGESAYNNMFANCAALTTPPLLPATDLATSCYQSMFSGCTALTTAPELAATELQPYCYNAMFSGCTALRAAPDLPATEMKTGCYQSMFSGCNNASFTTTPELPAHILAPSCYQAMFNGCTGLRTTMAILPATALANNCYYNMFYGCSGITAAPILSAPRFEDAGGNTTAGAYYQMFYGCSALNKISVYLENWGSGNDNSSTGNTYRWVYNVPQTGTFYCPTGLSLTYGSSNSNAHYAPWYTSYKWTVAPIQRMTFHTNGGTWDGTDNTDKVMAPPLDRVPVAIKENNMFVRWDTLANGTGDFALDVNDIPLGDKDYYAIYDLVDYHIVRWTPTGMVIHTTLTSAVNCTTRIQNLDTETEHTLSTCAVTGEVGEFFISHPTEELMDNAGKLIYLYLTDESDNIVGVYTAHIPFIITDDIQSSFLNQTMNSDVWVTSGATLTINDERFMKTLYIEGGSKVTVPAGNILHTDNIVMRAGSLDADGTYTFCYPQMVANGQIYNTSGIVNLDYTMDQSQFYSICLPGTVDLSDVAYEDGSCVVTAKSMQVQRYDGSRRATSNPQTGWVDLWHPNKNNAAGPYPKLQPGTGYVITARDRRITLEGSSTKVRRTHTTLRFPMEMDLTNGEQCPGNVRTVEVHPWGMTNGELNSGVTPNHAGWNLVGNPFLADIEIGSGLVTNNGIGLLDSIFDSQGDWTGEYEWVGNNRYAVIPSNDGQDYEQILLVSNTLPAFKNFFIQIGTGDVLSFSLNKRAQHAHARAWEIDDDPEQMIGIRLSGNGKTDRMGILLNKDYTDEYEFNADLDKWMNRSMNIYAQIGDYSLGMAALNNETQSIPLGVDASVMGDYTFSLDEDWTTDNIEFEHLYLEDNQENTLTDLLLTDYTCTLMAAAPSLGRFRLIPTVRQIPTDMPYAEAATSDLKISSKDGRINITGLHDAEVMIFTIMGTCVYNGQPDGELSMPLPVGTYLVSVSRNGETITEHVLLH